MLRKFSDDTKLSDVDVLEGRDAIQRNLKGWGMGLWSPTKLSATSYYLDWENHQYQYRLGAELLRTFLCRRIWGSWWRKKWIWAIIVHLQPEKQLCHETKKKKEKEKSSAQQAMKKVFLQLYIILITLGLE